MNKDLGTSPASASGLITTGDRRPSTVSFKHWTAQPSDRTPGRFIVFEGPAWVCDLNGRRAEERARLIAAAPELYAALKAILAAGDGHDAFTDEWPAARAAIAKAEGRS